MMVWMLLCAAWVDAQLSTTSLFTVPYGAAANQISLTPSATQTEGDFVDSEYPYVLSVIRFSLDGNIIDILAGLGYPTTTPNGDLGFLNFAPIEVADEQSLRYDGTKVRLLNQDKSVIAEFPLSQDVEVRYPSLSFVSTPNYLVLVDINNEEVINDKRYPLQKRRFIILNRQGHQVLTTELLVPLGSRRLWDTDESGNIYYLSCTPKGAELRRINIPAH
jgi:hypothetical protein